MIELVYVIMFNRRYDVNVNLNMNRMGVAWFHQHSPPPSDPEPLTRRLPFPRRRRSRCTAEEPVDVIDIEHEDHSFTAFFIGVQNKRPAMVRIRSVRWAVCGLDLNWGRNS